jgi:hypothetical protein
LRYAFAFLLACASAGPAFADEIIPPVVGGHSWTQHQLELAKARHPQVAWLRVEGAGAAGTPGIVLGDTHAISTVMKPVARRTAPGKQGGLRLRTVAFVSSTGHEIGTLVVAFRNSARGNAAVAKAIAADLARSTLSAKNAADPFPYDPRFRDNTYAQKLVTKYIRRYPDMLVMMIHATPPGQKVNVVIGSNIGRFGKAADEDDLRVIENGSTNLEVAESGDRFETELPLNDARGQRIGALGLVFNYKASDDKAALHAHGRAIRDALAREIPTNAALFAPAK